MTETTDTSVILSFAHVTGKGRRFHLKDINLELKAGYIYALMGENGAGKTTLLQYILDERRRYEGQIRVAGEDIRENHAGVMNRIGFVSEDNHFLENRTGRQNASLLGMLYDNFDMEAFGQAMEQMQVFDRKLYKSMSRGEKLKFQLAFAIAHSPCLYLLDEATAGMDPVFRITLFEMLQHLIVDERCAVLMTSHIASEVEKKTDYVGIMENGQIVRFGESLDLMTL